MKLRVRETDRYSERIDYKEKTSMLLLFCVTFYVASNVRGGIFHPKIEPFSLFIYAHVVIN